MNVYIVHIYPLIIPFILFFKILIYLGNVFIFKSPEKISNYVTDKLTPSEDTSVDSLVKAFMDFLDRKEREKPLTTKITTKEYSVKNRKNNIKKLLKEKPKVLFTELFEENNTPYIVVTFLSVLEMTKENDIIIRQDSNFKDITIELKVK